MMTSCNPTLMAYRQSKRVGFKRCQRGAATVEFAMIVPLFFLLLAGIIEFGQAFHIEHILSNASRLGARAAIVDGATTGEIKQKVKADCARTLGVNNAHIRVDVTVNGSSSNNLRHAVGGDEISVTVSVPFAIAATGFYANTFSNSTLSATCTMERELTYDR